MYGAISHDVVATVVSVTIGFLSSRIRFDVRPQASRRSVTSTSQENANMRKDPAVVGRRELTASHHCGRSRSAPVLGLKAQYSSRRRRTKVWCGWGKQTSCWYGEWAVQGQRDEHLSRSGGLGRGVPESGPGVGMGRSAGPPSHSCARCRTRRLRIAVVGVRRALGRGRRRVKTLPGLGVLTSVLAPSTSTGSRRRGRRRDRRPLRRGSAYVGTLGRRPPQPGGSWHPAAAGALRRRRATSVMTASATTNHE